MNAPRTLQLHAPDLVRLLAELPLPRAAELAGVDLAKCPRATCRAPQLFVSGQVWACMTCGAMGGPAELYLSAEKGWTFEQLHAAVGDLEELERIGREGAPFWKGTSR